MNFLSLLKSIWAEAKKLRFAKRSRKMQAEPRQNAIQRRGRKSMFTSDQLNKAMEMKRAGHKNRDVATILYNTTRPTQAQCRSVPTTLRYHFGPRK